jgi:ABC-2 type transport system ATP-binding protein
MKALLFIILSLATNVRLIILDEPTNGLDVIVKKKILQLLLEEVSDRNLSILISSHHLNELEKIVDKVLFMKDGTINKTVSLDEAKEQVKKFQIAFNEDLPEKFLHLPQIEIVSQMGRVYTILIKDNISETLQLIENKNPIFLEELQMSLEDLFVSVVGGKENV